MRNSKLFRNQKNENFSAKNKNSPYTKTKKTQQPAGILHREFCFRKRNHFTKDIGRLGRKLERIIWVEHDRRAVEGYEDNAIIVKEFNGDEGDTELIELMEFLKAACYAPDLREHLKKYGGDGDVGKR
jgi:mitochondrial import inner membrane translocase subunit TIM50